MSTTSPPDALCCCLAPSAVHSGQMGGVSKSEGTPSICCKHVSKQRVPN